MNDTSASLSHDDLLDRLADVAVATGVNVQEGQDLLVSADVTMVPLARRIVERAYARGAGLVTLSYDDEAATLARFRYGGDQAFDHDRPWLHEATARAMADGKIARLKIIGGDPNLLDGQDHEKVAKAERLAAAAGKPVIEKITRFETNWSIVAYASEAWAKTVFPNDENALARLWQAIFAASRVDASVADPTEAWRKHNAALSARRKLLDDKQYDALHFRGPGTDLKVGLAEGHSWGGGAGKTIQGVSCNPNIPTEEVFTTPHATRVDGTVASTKPLAHQGTLIRDIAVRFEGGRIVEASASTGEAALLKLLDVDDGARRLGEVALVPHSSPISASGILFYNTLFDENAACHIALGQSYAKCMKGGGTASAEELGARGANASMIHVDWMIGSGEIDIDGITEAGEAEPLMRGGEWPGEAR
ncbi:aminopeptidase [Pararhizobium mangrovi]|uniref:Aminopeptidase n=1 Tax=Pararhizobium mangrovi TaxID=2590452 RepID=A0A506UCK3_9HYPH|nr:aminopeptidase [Pararhizobium mangrovi]TPW30399.1 aminopeptidase [Pararhizobium mangrovi]